MGSICLPHWGSHRVLELLFTVNAKVTRRHMAAPKPGILSLTIRDKSALYSSYMPFIKNGGLFIPTTKSYKLGDEVFMLLTLMDEKDKMPIAGRIVWITPRGAQGN